MEAHNVALVDNNEFLTWATTTPSTMFGLGQTAQIDEPDMVMCTMDVNECSDGSYVSRNPLNGCAFDECPFEFMGCTEEARICPDGQTVVVRNQSRNCEFDSCPSEIIVCTMDVRECPDGSYVSRGGAICEFNPCPPEMLFCTEEA